MLVGVWTTLREIERVGHLAVRMRMMINYLYHLCLLVFVANGHLAGRDTVPGPLFVAVSVLLKMQ